MATDVVLKRHRLLRANPANGGVLLANALGAGLLLDEEVDQLGSRVRHLDLEALEHAWKWLNIQAAGMATPMPMAVVTSASAIPAETAAIPPEPVWAMPENALTMPMTVPNRPMNGAVVAMVARLATPFFRSE